MRQKVHRTIANKLHVQKVTTTSSSIANVDIVPVLLRRHTPERFTVVEHRRRQELEEKRQHADGDESVREP